MTRSLTPDEDRQEVIASAIEERSGFPGCIGLIDGSLINLEEKPLEYGHLYMSRKRHMAV